MDFEKAFRPAKFLDRSQTVAIDEVTDLFVDIAKIIDVLTESREKSICITKLQEAKMWAVECIAKNGIVDTIS